MRVISLFSILILLLVVTPVMAQTDTSSGTYVRFWNVTDDVPEVDLYVDGELLLENLQPASYSDFLSIAPGNHELVAIAAGQGIDGDRYLTAEFRIESGQWTNTFIVGSIAGNFVGVQTFERNPNEFLPDRLRFDVFNPFLQGDFTITLDSGEPQVLIPSASTTLEIPNGMHEIVIADINSGAAIYEDHDLNAAPFQSYFVTFSRISGEITPIVIAIDLNAKVIVNHFVADMPTAALRLNGEQLETVFPYESHDTAVDVHAGDYTLEIVQDNVAQPEVYFTQDNFDLAPGDTLVITMLGQLADESLKVTITAPLTLNYSTNAALMAGKNALVNLHHEISDAPPIDVLLGDGTTMIESLAFREGTGVLDLPAGTYHLVITAENDPDTVLYDLDGLVLSGGTVYDVLAIGSYQAVLDGEQNLVFEPHCVRPEGCDQN